ncbi:MAG TPA: DUF4168 domain-containing protein [Gammaproteobacteria bacterium]
MKRPFRERPFGLLCVLAMIVGFTHVALAQSPVPPPPPMPADPEAAPEVSDAELDTFTTIYLDLQELNSRFEAEMSSATSGAEAQEVQTRLQQETANLIQGHGWSLEQYNLVAQAINADAELLDQALELIAEKS